MRKHFLLLFLMALLPLAGWAAPISETDIKAESPFFGYLPNVTATGLAEGVDFEVVAYYTDETMATEVSETNVKKTDAGTDLVALVRGLGAYEGTVKLSFQIKKNALTIVGVAKSKVYGADDPTGDDFFTVTTVTDAAGTNVTTALAAKITFGRVGGNNKGEYAYTASFTGDNASLAGNYTIASADIKKVDTADPLTYAQAKFEITAKPFTVANISIDDIAGTFTYNGNAFTPTVTVKDNTLTTTPTVLTLGTDYTVAYSTNINAGVNTAVVTVTGKGNYSTLNLTKNFTINQAPLVVTPVLSKDYNGTDALPETTVASFTFQGWKKDDSNALVTAYPSNAQLTVTSPAIYAGTYTLSINNVDNFTIDGNNYKILKQNGTFTINKIDLAINVTDETKAYGVAPAKAITKTGTTIVIGDAPAVDDWTLIQDVVEVTVAETPEASGDNKGKYKMTPAAKANPYEAETANYNAFEAKLKTLNSYNVTWNPGYLTITKAPLYVGLDETKYTTLSKTYDGEVVSLADPTTAQLLVTGLLGEDTAAGVLQGTPGIEVENNSAKAGTYNIQVTGLTADKYEIVPITSQYKINKKALKVYIGDQTFVKGAALNLNQNLFTIDEEKGLASTDQASEVFKLTTTVTVGGDPEVITSDAGDYQINLADVGGEDSKYDNYTITTVNAKDNTKNYGVATVLDADAITLDESSDLTNLTGAAATKAAVVTFSSRNLKKGVWYTMALPFDITVRDLSNLMGYVVVDKFVANESSSDMNFKIFMGKINAYEPFLIKCDEDVNLNEKNIAVTLKKYANCTANMTQENASYYFKSNFKYAAVGENFWTDGSNMTTEQFMFNQYAGTAKLKALRAYITAKEGVTAAPNIFVEEPDGSTTAIQAISADGVAVPAQGWYTINGMKLEGMPTEKGVYINNGKKVVLK